MSLAWKFDFIKEENNQLFFECNDKKIIFMVLEEDLCRVFMSSDFEPALSTTWAIAPDAEDIPFEGRDRFDLTPFSLPAFQKQVGSEQVIIETHLLKAVIQLDGFKISWYAKINGEEILIANDRKTQSYNYNNKLGDGVYHYLERYKDDNFYGLGEKSGTLNKTRKRYIMKTIDAMGYDAEFTDPLYKHIPFYLTHNQKTKLSYGLFYDNYSDSIFDLGAELDNYHGFYRYYYAEKGDLDYYFILGPHIHNVVEKYSKLTGKTIFPPKWSLGYSGSTMTYTDAPDAQEQLKKFVDSCVEYDIPCDSFQLSSGYTTIGGKRYVFNWNYDKIPDPHAMNHHFHENGLHVCANIKPCLLQDHPQYPELAEKGMFIKADNNQDPELVQFWDDDGSYLDFTNPETIQWWKGNVKEQLLSFGIDSTWNDNNEFEIWNKQACANGFGKSIPVEDIKPIQTLLMLKSSYEAQKEFAPNSRPYLISRSGMPGMQRYVQTWSGDNLTEWKTLRFNIKMGLSMSLSGVYNFGHDVGGFSGLAPEPELFIRWIQNGIFHPRFTIHSWNEDQSVNVPWMYPEQIEIIRSFMKERVKWIPYFYHLLHKASQEYKPILTPTFYYFEHDSKTFEENDDFMVGENLLVCSVVEKGATQRSVYLPENDKGWYDMNSDQWYQGGQTIIVNAPLNVIPLFAQAGSAFPIRDGEITFKNKSEDARGIRLYPSLREEHISERFYEDDGISLNYTKGESSFLLVDMKTTKESVEIQITMEGNYQLPYDSVSIYLPKTEKRNLYVNGEAINSVLPVRVKIQQDGSNNDNWRQR
ncbi:glycoside hydrolase family 31 protein [Paenibacillus sp. BSR1-1]|uniref:glycoside hydrolase family 31 protein n=1 Tax=Paenibacillus sp. BSR1-1 TaxID=3020845 RepID=UPI0025AFA6F3|nr:glycoside hydrolase family 31 protein [Paenibacillus sp. BSR1-1]MDN3019101.1 glycoside hydrolase family 31 protein [Paenibacillus sp. BSR1-1]